MDSQLAANPVIRKILESLVTLEKAAGVRAHYRILDAPPLSSTDEHHLQTTARVLADWMGLRNAMFDISIISHENGPALHRIDPDREEFVMEISSRALASPETAIAAITRQVARAYLINSNIAASSIDADRASGSMADITAIFLGMGKLILNSPAAGQITSSRPAPLSPENESLSPEYLAFTHRLVCSMRGLDWAQHASGLNKQAIDNLRKWDVYRDSVFNQALRNVLTASASHRPLMDAIEDNQLALARFDQLIRTLEDSVTVPLKKEMAEFHITCREGIDKLTVREQETYDPCLLYLNQLRRRMDLQRYADVLHIQQDNIMNRLRVIGTALGDLNSRRLVHLDMAHDQQVTHCPFDGTPVSIDETAHDSRVKCLNCGYTFLASPGYAPVRSLPRGEASPGFETEEHLGSGTNPAVASESKTKSAKKKSLKTPARGKSNSLSFLVTGIALLPLSWLPMLIYALTNSLQGKPAPLIPLLGKLGMLGSGIGIVILLVGLVLLLKKLLTSAPTDVAPAETPATSVTVSEDRLD